jgi:integrase/recombinase XerC
MPEQALAMDIIGDFLEAMRRNDLSPRTIRRRESILRRLDATLHYGLARSTYDELVQVLAQEEWGIQTRASYTADVRAFFRWAVSPLDPRVDFDPAAMIRPPRVPRGMPRPVSDAELAVIVDDPDESHRLWSLLAAYAGLRCIEISRLDSEHITEERITVRGKGNKTRTIPTHPEIWKAAQGLPAGPVAVSCRGRRLGAKQVSARAAYHYCTRLGLTDVTLHRLRHWFGTNVQHAQGDIRVTQELMGHASPATTAIYTLVADTKKIAAVAALPPLRRAAA